MKTVLELNLRVIAQTQFSDVFRAYSVKVLNLLAFDSAERVMRRFPRLYSGKLVLIRVRALRVKA